MFNAILIEVADNHFVVELSGSSEKIDELIKALSHFKIIETARSGVTGVAFAEHSLKV